MKKISILLILFLHGSNFAKFTKAEVNSIGINGFDANKIEDFTREKFETLIKDQHEKDLNYLLAKVTSRNDKNKEHTFFYDENSFYQYFFGNSIPLQSQKEIDFYKALSTYPKITRERLNQLGLAIGLQKHHYLDNIHRQPIVNVEFFNLKRNKSKELLTNLNALLNNAYARIMFLFYIAENYPSIDVLLFVGEDPEKISALTRRSLKAKNVSRQIKEYIRKYF